MRSLLLFFIFLLISCSLDHGKPSGVLYEYDMEHEGMVRIDGKGHSVVLGTNDNSAASIDRPSMKVQLTYSFSISKNEVTREEYVELLGKDISLAVDSADLPQTNVTYYDAILYANARSKKEGYDTAYSYSSKTFDSEGNCSYLEGLIFDPSKESYRLPTEAEWVFAAQKGFNPEKSWTNANSDYRSHAVCSIGENDFTICDMAGNAMEWVNDWLGNLLDTTLTNFVGAPDGGSLGQRVLKGGSFKNAPESITLYSRGDVYAVTSSTKSDYVGFRLAFGSIPSPVWINGSKASSSRISILATSSEVKSMTGTYRAKLAFVNNETGNLAYIDFSNATLTVTEIQDTLPVFHPDISPDGKRVVFCTKSEGVSGTSEVYVRDLNSTGSNLVKLDVPSAAIPRFRVLPSGDTVIVYVSDAGNNKEEGSWKEKSTWQVSFSNGKFGTPVKLYDGSFHGGISEDESLTVTGARLLRANKNGKDTVWYNGEQACNASLSKDSTKRTMFLDFGSKTGKDFVGESYTIHERLLIADSTGKLIQSIKAPKNYTFDHTEWSNYTNIAVSSVANVKGAHTALYLISTADSSLLKLVEGIEVWHPNLWINKQNIMMETDLDLDSAGVYLAHNFSETQLYLSAKMELFWKQKDDADVVVLGSSRIEKAVDPLRINDYYLINMSTSGVLDFKTIHYFAKNYAFNHVSNLKYLVISLDLDGIFYNGNFLSQLFQELPGYIYDANHEFWKDGLPDSFITVLENSLSLPTDVVDSFSLHRGSIFVLSQGWRESPPLVFNDSLWADNQSERIEEWKIDLLTLIQESEQVGVKVIGIIFPQSPHYRETGAFGRYGLTRSKAIRLIEWIQSIDQKYSNFYLMDENKMGYHDYTDEMAYDYDHLSYLGAVQLTSRLDSLLRALE